MIHITDSDPHRLFLEAGDVYATREEVFLSTLLGSCVSVCLYDPKTGVFGMNHFVLPRVPAGTEDDHSGRYGTNAMDILIHRMVELGAQPRHLIAKAFGGANLFSEEATGPRPPVVGEENARFIQAYLAKKEILLNASDLGGTKGRNILFSGRDFSVQVRRCSASQTLAVAHQARRYE
ncbi:MAG: chemotaxis protein CheD [Candidatus Sedimenticola sp. (ex Thyasira tokunagai)]